MKVPCTHLFTVLAEYDEIKDSPERVGLCHDIAVAIIRDLHEFVHGTEGTCDDIRHVLSMRMPILAGKTRGRRANRTEPGCGRLALAPEGIEGRFTTYTTDAELDGIKRTRGRV